MSAVRRGGGGRAPASERILDAAGRVFLVHGVMVADMADIAGEAGFSRATLYRHFENRTALRIAYMHREARRVAGEVLVATSALDDAGDRITEAVLTAVRIVRETPVLAAWFTPAGSTATAGLAGASDVIESLCAALLDAASLDDAVSAEGEGTDTDTDTDGDGDGDGDTHTHTHTHTVAAVEPDPARWLVRVVVSLLTMPGRDEDDERAMVVRFVVPALLGGRQGRRPHHTTRVGEG